MFFFFLFSLYLPFTSVPSPSHLPCLGALKQVAPKGDRHLSPAWCCPGGPRPCGRERKGCFLLSFINLLLSPRAVKVIFCHTWQKARGHRWPPDICRPREGGCVVGGAASKSWGVWFVCLGIMVWNLVEIWNPSNATDFCFIFFCCNQEKNLAYNSSLIVSNVKLLGGLPGAFMSEVKCWGSEGGFSRCEMLAEKRCHITLVN